MTDSVPTVPLTDADMDRFHQLAPIALKNRTRGYFFNELETSFNFLLAGSIPILGVWKWGWSGTNWLVFLVVGCWLGLLLDCIRLHFLNKQVDQYVDGIIDDTFVSVVAEAVRAGQQEFIQAHVPKAPQYGMGIFIDWFSARSRRWSSWRRCRKT